MFRECVRLVKELGLPIEHIVLPTFAYEHKIFLGPFSRAFPQAKVWIAPRSVLPAFISKGCYTCTHSCDTGSPSIDHFASAADSVHVKLYVSVCKSVILHVFVCVSVCVCETSNVACGTLSRRICKYRLRLATSIMRSQSPIKHSATCTTGNEQHLRVMEDPST